MKKLILLLTACLIGLVNNSYAEIDSQLPTIVSSQWETVEKVGATRFKKFGLHVYNASFWSLRDNNSRLQPFTATALSISYARDVKAKLLLSSTYKEWQQLGFAQRHPLDAWLDSLEKIWPDIKKGDYLVFTSTNDGNNIFYSDSKILGSINDHAFGPAFLDIWLSINATNQKNRKELLGENN
jgi:hypothetical protein|tara:strand:- start:1350 stop:1898 length:549 start_codon:yes stop_codon:yes gene_type:complete